MSEQKKLLVIQCAALGWNQLDPANPVLADMRFAPLQTVNPAVTCTAQASFRTAAPASQHGMVANGLFHRNLRRSMFWEQAAQQVEGPRIWDAFRANGGTVGMTFWQQSLGEDVDLVLSPRPIHKHSGGMIQDCYSKPDALYEQLESRVNGNFNLMHYWGPLASKKSSAWITDALCELLAMPEARPDLLLTYLPHLDYDLQRHGPDHEKARGAREFLSECLKRLCTAAAREGYEVLIWGDYAMHKVTGPALFPNRTLREAGYLGTRKLKGMAYPDLFAARAFAMVDHEIAHLYIRNPGDLDAVREHIAAMDGVERVIKREDAPELNHPNSGELIAFAAPGRWFAYPWWTDPKEAPDFATHVDIHNKPGFDACELFFGRFPWQVSQDTSKVGGCHGAIGPESRTAWASTTSELTPVPKKEGDTPTLLDLARTVQNWLTPTP